MTDAPAEDPLARFFEYRETRDRRLRDELISEHLGLAIALARRFAGRGESVDDLEQIESLLQVVVPALAGAGRSTG